MERALAVQEGTHVSAKAVRIVSCITTASRIARRTQSTRDMDDRGLLMQLYPWGFRRIGSKSRCCVTSNSHENA
eukprot:2927474-Amphidinium_carterae.3